MERKPAHLGRNYADQFKEPPVVAAYRHRPPYVAEAADLVRARLPASGARVLDIGCGSGDWTLLLASRGLDVDAIDASAAMIETARTRPGADAVSWRVGPLESAPLAGPYTLATAAECLHWMEWSVVLPRLSAALAPGGRLTLLNRLASPQAWDAELHALIPQFSTNTDYAPYDLVDELARRGLFEETGRLVTRPERFEQSVTGYVESFHSRNGFSRARMGADAARAFDTQLTALVRRHVGEGPVVHANTCRLVFGIPTSGGMP